jgi:hypothetical protein
MKLCLKNFPLLALTAIAPFLFNSHADAATLTVTSLADSGPGSLRSALASATNGDTIQFSVTLPATITLTNGELLVTNSISIIGPGSPTDLALDGNHAGRVLEITPSIVVSLANLTITNGFTSGLPPTNQGGGILTTHSSLMISNCVLSGNSASLGGGVFNDGEIGTGNGNAILKVLNSILVKNSGSDGAAVGNYGPQGSAKTEITASVLSGNISSAYGGGVYNNTGRVAITNSMISSNVAVSGAGIYNYFPENNYTATADIYGCTIDGNSVSNGYGAGVFNFAFSPGLGTMTIINCTLSRNVGDSEGSAIENSGDVAHLTVSGCTLSSNSASGFLGSVANEDSGTLEIRNTILKGVPSGPIIYNRGTFISHGYNLCSDAAGGDGSTGPGGFLNATGDQRNTDPLLDPAGLKDNGGPTPTIALQASSPAVDAGNAGGLATDQRGAPRPNDNPFKPNAVGGDGSDIGAVELAPTLTTSVVGGGVTLRGSTPAYYLYGTSVNLTAFPALGWSFSNWSGDASGTANRTSVVMTTNKSVTANFLNNGSGCAPAPSGLVSWWPGAGDGKDIFGTNDCIVTNGATFAPGEVGQAFSRDGTNALIIANYTSNLLFPTQLSIETWVRPNAVTNTQQIFLLLDQLGAFVLLETTTNGALQLEIYNGVGGYDILDSSVPNGISAGVWSHVAATFNSGALALYKNGAVVASKVSTVTSIFSSPTAAVIGGALVQDRFPLSGLLDEAAVYNRALNSSEIQSIYNAGTAGKCLTPLYITTINRAGTNANLSWLAQRGVSYRVLYNSNLGPVGWTNPPDVTATNSITAWTDSTAANASQRFYRLRLLQ